MTTHRRHPRSLDPLLAELARLYGVQIGYRDSRAWREPPAESVVKVLGALGAALGDLSAGGDSSHRLTSSEVAVAIRERKRELWSRILEPVLVAWDGVLPAVIARLPVAGRRPEQTGRGPGASGRGGLKLTLTLEGGAEDQWEVAWDLLELVEADAFAGERFEARRATGLGAGSTGAGSAGTQRGRLPLGYHRLRVEAGCAVAETVVISAPQRCWTPGHAHERDRASSPAAGDPAAGGSPRDWGVFAPLYALRSERNWGAGDLADLGKLRDWVAGDGGSVIATLPLLASYLDCPFEPSPYRPVSRLFWNEFYLAVDLIAEWEQCTAARELWESAEVKNQVGMLRAESLVDYKWVMALKRRALEESAQRFFTGGDAERKEAFSAWVRTHPDAEQYAAFRAGVEAAGADWRSWPDEPPTDRADRRPPEGSAEANQYHLYCQWQMGDQLSRLSQLGVAAKAGRPSPGLFLDLPLGVHPGGFDTWRWPQLFATRMSTGAPPDTFFALGQDWESPPLHPERIREQGHEYFARCIRHQMLYTRYLRIDHVMSLHRLFWVPEGTEPTDGVYVTYPSDELYGVLCLESRRNRTVVVGEDLGTVPAGVRSSMRRHGVLGTWVFQASLRSRGERPVGGVPRHTVASLNTHDMFPFPGFLRGEDIIARVATGQLDWAGARREIAVRHRLVARLAAFLRPTPAAGPGAPPQGSEPPPAAGPVDPTGQAEPDGLAAGAALLTRVLAYLAAGPAALVMVNLEDLLLETRPQNLPGTGAEWGNWRRKAAGSETDAQRAIAAAATVFAMRGQP